MLPFHGTSPRTPSAANHGHARIGDCDVPASTAISVKYTTASLQVVGNPAGLSGIPAASQSRFPFCMITNAKSSTARIAGRDGRCGNATAPDRDKVAERDTRPDAVAAAPGCEPAGAAAGAGWKEVAAALTAALAARAQAQRRFDAAVAALVARRAA